MKYLLAFMAVACVYLISAYRIDQAYAQGKAEALKINPVSAELEAACLSLWVGDVAKKQYEKDMK